MLNWKQMSFSIDERSPKDARSFKVTLYDATELDRDGETIHLATVRVREPVTLQVDHDKSVLKTVGWVNGIHVDGMRLRGTLTFAPEGVSEVADQVYRQVDAGVTRTVSVGFLGTAKRAPEGHTQWTNVEVVELSFVSIPSSPGARVDQKALERWLASSCRTSQHADGEMVLEIAGSEPADDVVLIVQDDDPVSAMRREIAAAAGTAAGAAARAALRARGFAVSDPPGDPSTRHGEVFVVDERMAQAVIAQTVREVVGSVVRDAAVSAIARLRGRVD
jgi:hypothetical protein